MKSIKKLLRKPDQDDFAQLVTDTIRGAGNTDSIEYDAGSFKLVVGSKTQMYLHNVYGDYIKSPRQHRAEILKRYATGWMSITGEETPVEDALPNLLPIVRACSYHDISRLVSQVEGTEQKDVPIQPLADHLAVSLAVDAPETIRYVVQQDLTAWSLPFEDALERARDNLWNRSGGKFATPIAGVYFSHWHDSYDSSRLFLYDLLWHLDVNGDHVAAVPNRETLIVTGSEDYGGLAMMARMCEKSQDEPRPVSCIPVILQEKTWVTYQPESGHPEHDSFKKLRIIEHARDYAQQKDLLERWHKITGEQITVAEYVPISRRDTGAFSSYCCWTEEVPILLPEADEVAFFKDSRVVGKAAWGRVREVAGDLMESPGLYPRRFWVEKFPSPEQLAALLSEG